MRIMVTNHTGMIFTEEQYKFLKDCRKDKILYISDPSPEHKKVLEELTEEGLVTKTNGGFTSYEIKKEAYRALGKEKWLRNDALFLAYLFFHPDRPLPPRKYPGLKTWQRW
jgi:hypothetical protein